MPTHYSFKVGNRLGSIRRRYERLKNGEVKRPKLAGIRFSNPSDTSVRSVIDRLDSQGRWIDDKPLRAWPKEEGKDKTISTSTFIKNITILSDYLASQKSERKSERRN